MKIISKIYLTTFIVLSPTQRTLLAMKIEPMTNSFEQPTTQNLREELTAQANLDEFLNCGTVLNRKDIQKVAPDNWALRMLKPANVHLIYRFDHNTILNGYTAKVFSAAFSPDGKSIVTASDDKTAHVWRQQKGVWTAEILNGYINAVSSAAFSPDGSQIITASSDKTARIWQALDLVGEENIAAKIVLLHLLKLGDHKAIKSKPHLKELFTKFSLQAQDYLEKEYLRKKK